MASVAQPEALHQTAALAGRSVVARIRRLIVVAVVAIAGYATFTMASRGYCPGGVTAEGAFIDGAGNPTDVAATCVNLTLQPSGLVYLAVAVIVIGAVTQVLRRAHDEMSAIRCLDRAATLVAILAVASVTISQVWFFMIPIADWNGTGTFFYPFPFGSVDMDVTPTTNS